MQAIRGEKDSEGIRAPTLVFHGTDDPLFPYEHALALANEIPGARLIVLSETGHEYFPRALGHRGPRNFAAHVRSLTTSEVKAVMRRS
jgi:predicted alpha/beta hydrolase family esterase